MNTSVNTNIPKVKLRYQRLEQRRVLNADFSLLAGVLDIGNFSELVDEGLSISDNGSQLQFQLDEGIWGTTNNPGNIITGTGTNTISVPKSLIGLGAINSIVIDAGDVGDADIQITTDTDLTGLRDFVSIETGGDIGQVTGTSILVGDLQMSADEICLINVGNDFQGVVDAVGSTVELVDANALSVNQITASDDIRLQSGAVTSGGLTISGNLRTLSVGGQTLLQSSDGVAQTGGVIGTEQLLLQDTSAATSVDAFEFNSNNLIDNISADIQGNLSLTNVRSLELDQLTYSSSCSAAPVTLVFDVGSVDFNIMGDLVDSASSAATIDTTANFDVSGDIVLGDGAAQLVFGHQIGDLLNGQLTAPGHVTIDSAITANLEVDSTVIFADVNLQDSLIVDASGDILQTLLPDGSDADALADDTTIDAPLASLTSDASIQLVNTNFDDLAAVANTSSSQLISPFVINQNILSTFTGSLVDNFTTDIDTDGDGVFEVFHDDEGGVNTEFTQPDFAAGNHEFVNNQNIGVIVDNQTQLAITEVQGRNGVVSQGDVYIETADGHDLNVLSDVLVTDAQSNITLVAGETFSLDADLRRASAAIVNTAETEFTLLNPRSAAGFGNEVFSDSLAGVDPTEGFQTIEFEFGNAGEFSFNVLIGWIIEGIDTIDAIQPEFQQVLVQQSSLTTNEFLFSDPTPDGIQITLTLNDSDGFGETIDGFAFRTASGQQSLQNIDQFNSEFLSPRGFALSQIFVTNDAKINFFEDAGVQDLNFSQDVLATRTVVENPGIIQVARPVFEIPSPPDAVFSDQSGVIVQVSYEGSDPILTEDEPESYYLVKFTEDDDGVFEEEFRWTGDEDPDAIRAMIEDASLDVGSWPDTADEEGNWTEQIRDNKAKPGLYFIYEVQEGEELPQPVDEPVDRTDLESLRDEQIDLLQQADEPSLGTHVLPKPVEARTSYANLALASAIALSNLKAQRKPERETNCDPPNTEIAENMFSRRARMLRRLTTPTD